MYDVYILFVWCCAAYSNKGREHYFILYFVGFTEGARCSSVVRAFAHGAMGRRIDPSWG